MVVTLLTALIIGFALASYLQLVSSQNVSTMRSLAWNSAVPILEAGVEEALTQLRYRGLTNLTADNWVPTVTPYGSGYVKERLLGGSRYEVVIVVPPQSPPNTPKIYSTAFVPAPLAPGSIVGMVLGAAIGADSPASSPGQVIRRCVRVDTTKQRTFNGAMVADGQIDLKGMNIATDSFNSMTSTGHTYPDPILHPTEIGNEGDVATNSGLISSLNMGNADIMGHVSTGPGGSVALGPGGVAGSTTWVQSGTHNGQIEKGWSSDDMNVEFPPVQVPTTGSSVAYGTRIVGTNTYNFVLGSGSYEVIGSKGLTGNVLVQGDVVLYVPQGSLLNFSGEQKIVIERGASLKLYVGCATATWSGNAGIDNRNVSDPVTHDIGCLHFQYFGLPTNKTVSMTGNAEFAGVVYAPDANLTLGGSGAREFDLIGATVTQTVTMNGHMNFHYDEALREWGPDLGYVAISWDEI